MYTNATMGSSGLGFTRNRKQPSGHMNFTPTIRGRARDAERTFDKGATSGDPNVGILEKRTDYLEGRERVLSATLQEMRALFNPSCATEHWVNGTCILRTTIVIGEESDSEAAVISKFKAGQLSAGIVEPNAHHILYYPMHKIQRQDKVDVVMRAKLVDSKTASIRWGWIVVFSSSKNGNNTHFYKFS